MESEANANAEEDPEETAIQEQVEEHVLPPQQQIVDLTADAEAEIRDGSLAARDVRPRFVRQPNVLNIYGHYAHTYVNRGSREVRDPSLNRAMEVRQPSQEERNRNRRMEEHEWNALEDVYFSGKCDICWKRKKCISWSWEKYFSTIGSL